MNYEQATTLLATARNRSNGKPIANNTRLFDRGTHIAVRLHNTDIVGIYPDGTFTLNTGGWFTVTTKARINEFAGVHIYSKKGVWYIGGHFDTNASEFYDNMRIGKDGLPLEPQISDKHLVTQLDRAIKNYKSNYIKAMTREVLEFGQLPQSSPGDCWGCLMVTKDGRNDVIGGVSHYFEHFREGYYVPALLQRAIIERGYREPGFIWHMIGADIKNNRPSYTLTQALTAYFRKRKPLMLEALREGSEILSH